MRNICLFAAVIATLLTASTGWAAQISGEYLEARSCDVYTGPCFANAEVGLAGKEAVMAWKVDQGSWKGVSLDGLSAALVVNSEGTLGYDGVFPMKPGKIKSVILVDQAATPEQHAALVAFVKDTAKQLTGKIVRIESAPLELKNDHLSGTASFKAGKLAQIETRGLKKGDCVCTNEEVYYLPLMKVENYSPAYSLKFAYEGDALNNRWTSRNTRSAFLATFRR